MQCSNRSPSSTIFHCRSVLDQQLLTRYLAAPDPSRVFVAIDADSVLLLCVHLMHSVYMGAPDLEYCSLQSATIPSARFAEKVVNAYMPYRLLSPLPSIPFPPQNLILSSYMQTDRPTDTNVHICK